MTDSAMTVQRMWMSDSPVVGSGSIESCVTCTCARRDGCGRCAELVCGISSGTWRSVSTPCRMLSPCANIAAADKGEPVPNICSPSAPSAAAGACGNPVVQMYNMIKHTRRKWEYLWPQPEPLFQQRSLCGSGSYSWPGRRERPE